jgi:hypothetical protein
MMATELKNGLRFTLILLYAGLVGCDSNDNNSASPVDTAPTSNVQGADTMSTDSDHPADSDTGNGNGTDCPLETLFAHNFDANTSGTYSEAEWRTDWHSPPWDNNVTYNYYASIVASDQGQSLEVLYPEADGTSGGVKWRAPLDTAYNEAYLSYDIRFSENWNGSADGGKLPGLCGGTCPSGGECEGGPCVAPTTGFSVRLMFDGGDGHSVRFYNYYNNKSEYFGSYCPEPYTDYNCRYGASILWEVDTTPGAWHNITMRVAVNTPGAADGLIEGFFDGRLVAQQEGVIFRPEGESFAIEQIMFETFFGGSTGPIKDETVQFDNVQLFRYTSNNAVTGSTPSANNRQLSKCTP